MFSSKTPKEGGKNEGFGDKDANKVTPTVAKAVFMALKMEKNGQKSRVVNNFRAK